MSTDIEIFADLVRTIRPNVIVSSLDPTQLFFDPPLTSAEQATLDAIVAATRSKTGLSPTDYAAVRSQMQILRDLRQLGRNAFVAQTQAQINRQEYDCLVAITEIFLKVFRDP